MRKDIERILDEQTRGRCSVIVRMETERDESQDLIKATWRAMAQRAMTRSARDTLPLERQVLMHRARSASRRPSRSSPASLVAQSAYRDSGRKPSRAKAASRRALATLLKSDQAQKTAEYIVRRRSKRSRGKGTPVPVFVSSNSALLDLTRDDLSRLDADVAGIDAVYPNRRLGVPRTVEIRSLPENILDNKTSAWGIHAINALAAWGAYSAGGAGTKIAVLDTGVDATHPELAGKIATSDWAEFDEFGAQVSSSPHDTHQHGTHVCGTIAGGNEGGPYIGVAPDAALAVALVLDGEKGGTDAQVLAGIDWAIARGVDAINMSLGGLTLGVEPPDLYTDAIVSALLAGIPVITAIGNEGDQTTGTPGNDFFAFAVGATDSVDRAAGFSGGRTQVITQSDVIPPEALPLPYSKPDLSAPGVAIQSCVPGDRYAAFSGTSMATPHVSGAIALILSATSVANDLSGADRAFFIQDLLTSSVEELGESGQDHRFGFGRIDVLRAIGFAMDLGF